MNLPTNFQFSQGSLQDYVDCPRRFQLKYMEQIAWPALEVEPAIEHEVYLQRGSEFHRMLMQYFLGVSEKKISVFASKEDNLSRWWNNFLSIVDNFDGLSKEAGYLQLPEFSLTIPVDNYRLTGNFDLLVNTGQEFIIYDWKTSRRQPNRDWLSTSLQTRVYPYLCYRSSSILANNAPIEPSQIKMVYWYAEYPTVPLTFQYNAQKFTEDQDYFSDLIREISTLGDSPAQLTPNEKLCRYCVYRSLCNRGIKAGPVSEQLNRDSQYEDPDLQVDFDQIAEIEF